MFVGIFALITLFVKLSYPLSPHGLRVMFLRCYLVKAMRFIITYGFCFLLNFALILKKVL